jgi:hypothetical protein
MLKLRAQGAWDTGRCTMGPRGKIISFSPSKTTLQDKAVSLARGEKTVSRRTQCNEPGTNKVAVYVLEFISRNSYRADLGFPSILGSTPEPFAGNIRATMSLRRENPITTWNLLYNRWSISLELKTLPHFDIWTVSPLKYSGNYTYHMVLHL